MAKKDLKVVQNSEDQDDGESSFSSDVPAVERAGRGLQSRGSIPAGGMNRADRREMDKRIARATPLSVEELEGETAQVDVFQDGRLVLNFYIHRFTTDLLRPIEELERRQMIIQEANQERERVRAMNQLAQENAYKALERGEVVQVPTPAPLPPLPDLEGAMGSDYFDAQIHFLCDPEVGVLKSWNLRLKKNSPELAPMTPEYMKRVLGMDVVGYMIRGIRERWTPGNWNSVASA